MDEKNMPDLRETLLRNRERLARLLEKESIPYTEESRRRNFGEFVQPLTELTRQAADQAVEAYLRECSNESARGRNRETPKSPAAGSLIVLASAFQETGEEKYAELARSCYADWMRARPGADSAKGAEGADRIAHGLPVLLGQLHVFLKSEHFDDEFIEQFIRCSLEDLNYLAANIYPARNLRFSYACGLLRAALLLEFLPEAKPLLELAARVLEDACHRQIMPDGSHLEATPHYQFCAMGDILTALRWARLKPELGMRISPELVASLYDYLVAATRPTGWVASIGDGPYEDPAAASGNGIADVLKEQAEFRRSLGLEERPLPTVQVFPHAGQAFLRDGWDAQATYITFDATACRSYHWHASRNAIQLQAYGRLFIVDPGRFSYMDPIWGGYGRSTRAHSTLNLNGWNQAESTAQLRHRAAPAYDVVEGYYDGGYWRGMPGWDSDHGEGIYAQHHRTLLWIRGRCIVVIDHLLHPTEPGKKPRLESVWQLAEGPVRIEAENGRARTEYPDANLLMLFPLMPEGAKVTLCSGEKDPLRGWAPKSFNVEYVPAPQVCLRVDDFNGWHADLATVLVPYRGVEPPQVEVTSATDPGKSGDFYHPSCGMLALRWGDGSSDEVWWMREMAVALNERDGFRTDGSLVHLHKSSDCKLLKGLVVDGTRIEPYAPIARSRPETFTIPY